MGLRDEIPESLRGFFFDTGPSDDPETGGGGGSDEPLTQDPEEYFEDGVNPLAWLSDNLSTLKNIVKYIGGSAKALGDFADNPIQFLRGKIIPALIGVLLGFTNTLANSFAAPFEAIQIGLETLGDALVAPFRGQLLPITFPTGDNLAGFTTGDSTFLATGAIAQGIASIVGLVTTTIETATAPLGPLQPFGVAALTLATGYVALLLTLRAGRGVLDAIPGLSGIETFLFG